MSLIYKQATESSIKSKEVDKNINSNFLFKYLLKCKSCLWNITFYESTGSISINSKKIRCPVCKEKEIKVTKIKIIL